MISEIRLRNFKLFEKLELQTELITVLIGPNGSGKSTVLQSLQLMKQLISAANLRDALAGQLKLGDFSDVTRHGAKELGLGLSVAVDVPGDGFGAHSLEVYEDAVYDSDVGDNPTHLGVGIRRGVDVLAESSWARQEPAATPKAGTLLEIDQTLVQLSVIPHHRRFPTDLRSDFGTQQHDVSPGTRQLLAQTLGELSSAVPSQLNRTFLVPALRGFHKLAYEQARNVQNVEDLMHADGPEQQARAIGTLLGSRLEIRDKISVWMKRITGRNVESKLAPEFHFAMGSRDEAGRFNIVNEGFATNQLIHPLTQLAIAPQGSTIEIEEPEIHLHPRAQAELVRVLVEVAKSERKQLLLTTHSEHVLMALVTEVAKGNIAAEDVALYYLNREGDKAVKERLEVTPQGQVKGGLKGFFDVEIEQMQEYLSALASRG